MAWLRGLSGAQALVAAVAIMVLAGLLGAAIDALSGTRGWWIALGSLGLCFGALYFAAVNSRRPSRPRSSR